MLEALPWRISPPDRHSPRKLRQSPDVRGKSNNGQLATQAGEEFRHTTGFLGTPGPGESISTGLLMVARRQLRFAPEYGCGKSPRYAHCSQLICQVVRKRVDIIEQQNVAIRKSPVHDARWQ